MKYLILAVAVVSLAVLVRAECPKVKPMNNFKDKDLVGGWFLAAQTNRSGLESSYPLLVNEQMNATKDGKMWTLNFSGYDPNNGTKYVFEAVGPQAGKAYLNLTMYCPDVNKNYIHDVTILGSDKKSFIVLFSCNFPNPNKGHYWIFTRREGVPLNELPLSEQLGISKILITNGFSPFQVRRSQVSP